MFGDLAAVISALAAIVASYFGYNQYTKNKMTDLKIEQFKKDEERKQKRRADNCGIIFGEIWNILHELEADRVYIVQPHPLGNEEMLSIYFEVKSKGVEGMKPKIHGMKISDVPKFASMLVQNVFLAIRDVDKVEDPYARSLMSTSGCKSVFIKRLSDGRHDWVGSIFCEFTHAPAVGEEEARAALHEAAVNIQYILPEYKD